MLTPNLPEAARLRRRVPASDAVETAARGRALPGLCARAVVMKGGHPEGPGCIDRLVRATSNGATQQARIATGNTPGTGCSLSSATAAELAKGASVEDAVRRSQAWLHGAIRKADGLGIGSGHCPLLQFHAIRR